MWERRKRIKGVGPEKSQNITINKVHACGLKYPELCCYIVVAIALMKHVCLFVYSQLLDLSRKDKPKARVLKLNNQVAVSLFEVVNKFKWS